MASPTYTTPLGPKLFYSKVTDIIPASKEVGPNSSSASAPLLQSDSEIGIVRWEYDRGTGALKAFRLMKLDPAAATCAANDVLGVLDVNFNTATNVVASYLSRNHIAGVAMAAVTPGSYGWFQVYGPTTLNLKTAINASIGESVILSDTTKVVDRVAVGTATTYRSLGYATANASGAGGTVTVFLQCV